jgi:hypothetical protein
MTPNGVSEFTFAGLFLFRERYHYMVSRFQEKTFIISGTQPVDHAGSMGMGGKKFFLTPCAVPARDVLEKLFETHDYWKNISDSVLVPEREHLESAGFRFEEDRDNFDYLYLRSDLATLSGKKFHKKKNLVNAFNLAYPDHEGKPLTKEIMPDALHVLDRWREEKGEEGDYVACKAALELFEELGLEGMVFYIDGRPAGWCLGEPLAHGRMFAIHFEKCIETYKGIYQYVNQAFAASLPEDFIYLNREQDLGDEGLRQAKMTYRPAGFVRKFQGTKN